MNDINQELNTKVGNAAWKKANDRLGAATKKHHQRGIDNLRGELNAKLGTKVDVVACMIADGDRDLAIKADLMKEVDKLMVEVNDKWNIKFEHINDLMGVVDNRLGTRKAADDCLDSQQAG